MGGTNSSGYIQINYGDEDITVCGNYELTPYTATLVCNKLGFSKGYPRDDYYFRKLDDYQYEDFMFTSQDFECSPTAKDVSECHLGNVQNDYNCYGKGVMCFDGNCKYNKILYQEQVSD